MVDSIKTHNNSSEILYPPPRTSKRAYRGGLNAFCLDGFGGFNEAAWEQQATIKADFIKPKFPNAFFKSDSKYINAEIVDCISRDTEVAANYIVATTDSREAEFGSCGGVD